MVDHAETIQSKLEMLAYVQSIVKSAPLTTTLINMIHDNDCNNNLEIIKNSPIFNESVCFL